MRPRAGLPACTTAAVVAAALSGLAILIVATPAASEPPSPAAQQGRAIVSAHCARCHAVDRTGESPLKAAPPFRTLHLRYPVESLEESLAEGIITGHPAMPEFRFSPEQVGDIIAYLKSLER